MADEKTKGALAPRQRDAASVGNETEALSADPSGKLKKGLARARQLAKSAEDNALAQLPLWPEPKRGAPNSFIRSALFAAIQGKAREYIKGVTLASQSGIVVKYTGEQLNQNDLDVWETLVHLAREQPLGTSATFSAHSVLTALGLPTGNSQHKQLHSTIIRLSACSVEVTHDGRTYFGPLIKSGAKDEVTKHYVIELNKEIIRLFGENQWTALDWQQRLQLKEKPLTQALHAYYSSHREPFPVKLETLKAYTGSRNKQPAGFRRQVREALQVLKDIGFLSDFKIDGELVYVWRVARVK